MYNSGMNQRLQILCLTISVIFTSVAIHAQRAPGITKPPNHGGLYVVAHRGAHQGIPENSLAAYQKAIDLGCDFVEIDLRTTKDGHFVSIHNSTVDAYGEGFTGTVKDMTLAEIRALDIGLRVGPEWKDTRVPTFDEILEVCQGKIGIYLDMKSADIADALKKVQEYNMQDSVLFLNGARNLKRLMQLSDKAIPMPDPGDERNLPRIIKRLNPSIIAPVWNDFSDTYAKTCHDAGAKVIVDEKDKTSWPTALEWKADGIQTDHPEELIAWLKARE